VISAISAHGALRFSVFAGTLTASRFIDFLKRLRHDAEHTGQGPVFCIVDGHPAHRAKAVNRFVASTDGALRLYRLQRLPHIVRGFFADPELAYITAAA
jgi:hypothetical protein